uniref:hypothetical protein n=1 Tax=Gordonia sp. B7-2 TaxID=3420932 RepID=UPI003D91709F
MTRTRTGVAAALALTVGLATACTSTEKTDSTSSATAGESASSTAETNTSRAVTSTAAIPTTGPAGIVEAIATAGGECGRVAERTERTERSCMLNGISFTLAESGWQAQAADRKRACDEGYISTEYQLLSDGRWTIAADYDEDYAAIKTALARLGINAELRPYC